MIRISWRAAVAALAALAWAGGAQAQATQNDRAADNPGGALPGPGEQAAPEGGTDYLAGGSLSTLPADEGAAVGELGRIVIEQGRQLDFQARQLQEQSRLLETYRQALEEHRGQLSALQLQLTRGAGQGGAKGPAPAEAPAPAQQQAQQPSEPAQEASPEDTATRPEDAEEERPEVALIGARGGVLTPAGTLVLEPEFEYTNQSENRFLFQGVEIVETVLIGFIEATSAQRNSYTGSLSARYGITNRLEVGTRIPYVLRDDRVTNEILELGGVGLTRQLSANDLGDIEVSGHYQVNDGLEGWPYFIANLRAKSTTGVGPFDVDRDSDGIETELPTGSGFFGVEPSVTILYPTDPAVLFANVGYVWNFGKDIDQLVGDSLIGRVDPGNTLSMSFGIGIGLNEMVSLSFGYEHSFVQGTKSVIDGSDAESDDLQVGSLLFGISSKITDSVGVNVNLAAGLTDEAPDVRVSVRVPVSLDLFTNTN